MNEQYDPQYRAITDEIAREKGIKTHHGIYVAVTGPNLETRAECAAFQMWAQTS